MDWTSTTALITGASSGIGAATARYLAQRGMRVILIARREELLIAVQQEIESAGGTAIVLPADLSSESDRIRVYREVITSYGVPDILINNAGFGWYGYFLDMPFEIARNLIEVDVMATVHLTHLFLPLMLQKPEARIINIGSIAGGLPEQGVAMYASAKAFLNSFSTSLFRELRGTSTSVSILRAGPVRTEFFDRARNQPNGHSVPAESMAVSADRVAAGIWRLIRRPRRVLYVPFYYLFSPLLETLFGWAIDLVGPLLLRKNIKKIPR